MSAARRIILVVDDNAVNQKIMVGQLESLGYAAQAVNSGERALALVAERRFDAILMDCQMPVLDGYDTTRAIRKLEGDTQHTVVIAVTAHALLGERQRCLTAGMDDYLPKPFRAAELNAVLQRWFDHEETVPEQPPPPQQQSAVLDSDTIDVLRNLGVLGRVLDLFLDGLKTHMSTLRSAVDGGRFVEARQAAHTLRGASAQIGAQRFSALCEHMENAAEEADGAASREHLRALEAARPVLEAEVTKARS
ncbi:MAG: response regulator [Myxococcales bacterium]|nr:response regulator [Myxococcales bacterium]